MSFDWRKLLKIAAQMIDGTPTEAQCRTAMNRAYYAAFKVTSEYVAKHGYVWRRGIGGSHQQVWHYLRSGRAATQQWLQPAHKSVADQGLALKDQRTWADYASAPPPGIQEAQAAITTAKIIVDRLQNMP